MVCNVYTYSPEDVILSFGGYTVEGWNSLTIRKRLPTFSVVQGIRGKNTRVRNKNSHTTIEINVDMVSELNRVLSQIVRGDLSSGSMMLALSLVDKSGAEVFSSIQAFVADEPDRVYDNTMQSREWHIECLTSTYDSNIMFANAVDVFSILNDGSLLNGLFN